MPSRPWGITTGRTQPGPGSGSSPALARSPGAAPCPPMGTPTGRPLCVSTSRPGDQRNHRHGFPLVRRRNRRCGLRTPIRPTGSNWPGPATPAIQSCNLDRGCHPHQPFGSRPLLSWVMDTTHRAQGQCEALGPSERSLLLAFSVRGRGSTADQGHAGSTRSGLSARFATTGEAR
jgi:hypothetical protein